MASTLIVGPQEKSTREAAGEMLRDFYLRSHRVIDRMMASEGASFARTRLLMHIAREGPLRSVDIATSLGLAPRTVTEAIDGLERDGLVKREPDSIDRRAKQISITAEGLSATEGAQASKRRYIDTVFGALTLEECGELVRLIASSTIGSARWAVVRPPDGTTGQTTIRPAKSRSPAGTMVRRRHRHRLWLP